MFNTILSVAKCPQWQGCIQRTSSKGVVINFFNNTSPKSLCRFQRKFVENHTHCRYVSTDNSSKSSDESNVEKLLEDSTVPEESTVEGDTENWTTSPYPKGLNSFSNRFLKIILIIYVPF